MLKSDVYGSVKSSLTISSFSLLNNLLPKYVCICVSCAILTFNSLIASINRALKLPYATDLIPVLASVSTTSGSTFSTA